MDSVARRNGGGVFEGLYRVIMRRNSVYVTFIIAGAFLGERAVDYGVKKLWEYNNVGLNTSLHHLSRPICICSAIYCTKRYEDIPVLGQRPAEE